MSTFKNTTSYKSNLDDLFLDWDNLFSHAKHNSISDYTTRELEDGKIQVDVNVLGHDPKNILLEGTEERITVKSSKPVDSSFLVKDIDFSFKLGKDYDGTKSEAKFNNGVLSIIIDKKDERKAKKLSINIR
jgi:HSP20 family molecular chaperone IbpA